MILDVGWECTFFMYHTHSQPIPLKSNYMAIFKNVHLGAVLGMKETANLNVKGIFIEHRGHSIKIKFSLGGWKPSNKQTIGVFFMRW